MVSAILIGRLNAIRILRPFITDSLLTRPAIPFAYFCSKPSNPSANKQNFDPNAVFETLACYNNDWKRALNFFYWVEDECGFRHTIDTYNRMIDILAKFFEFDLSWGLIQEMKGNPFAVPNHATFRVLFKRYISAHLVNEAISTYDRLEEFNLKDETSYFILIDALCEYKHVLEAQEFCFRMNKDCNMNVKNATKIHNMILRGWFKMEWWSKCRESWEEMDRKGVSKDLHSYSIYMDILSKSGRPWKAVKLYKEMKRKGMKLDVVAYNTVIQAIGVSQGVDFATSVYHEMKELGCQPNVVTCNTVIKLLCENGRELEAYKLLAEMHKKGIVPNAITYHCFFRCLVKPKQIILLFERMIDSGVQPQMDTYVMLMRKFGRWGFLRPVFMVWKKMEELGCSPDGSAYNALIDTLIDKGMLDMARKYQEEMLAKGLSVKPREELGTGLLKGG